MKTKIAFIILFLVGIHSSYAQEHTQEAFTFSVKQPTELFIGQIMKASSLNKEAYEFPQANYNSITITGSNTYSQEILPSYSNMMTYLREKVIGSGSIKQNQSFSYNSRELQSYSELSILFGQDINMVQLFGISATQNKKKTLAIIDINQSYFSVVMDYPYPNNGEAKKPEEIQKLLCSNSKELGDINDLIYVNTIQFGRKVTILVESPYSYVDVNAAIKDMMNNTGADESKISDKSKAIIANSTIRTTILNDDAIEEMNPENPFASLVNYLKKPVGADDFCKPIAFSASYLKDNSVFVNTYTVK